MAGPLSTPCKPKISASSKRYTQAQWEQNGVRDNISEENSLKGWEEVARCRLSGALGAEEMQVGRQEVHDTQKA